MLLKKEKRIAIDLHEHWECKNFKVLRWCKHKLRSKGEKGNALGQRSSKVDYL